MDRTDRADAKEVSDVEMCQQRRPLLIITVNYNSASYLQYFYILHVFVLLFDKTEWIAVCLENHG